MSNKIPSDYIEYFRKTGKSLSTFKTMPESYKIILDNMTENEWTSVFSIMCIYNLKKQEAPDLNLRTKEMREIYSEVFELTQRGFLEKVVINDMISNKIKSLQALV